MKKPYAIERRIRPEKIAQVSTQAWIFKDFAEWHKCKSYETTKDRDEAIRVLTKKTGIFEYRVKED